MKNQEIQRLTWLVERQREYVIEQDFSKESVAILWKLLKQLRAVLKREENVASR